MQRDKRNYIAIFGKNEFENLQIILECWFRNRAIHIIIPEAITHMLNFIRRVPFVNRYIAKSIKTHRASLDDHKGLWYAINEETIGLTLDFYNKKLKDKRHITYYKTLFNTDRFEAYIKREIALQIAVLLKSLHLIRLGGLNNNDILMVRNVINEFVLGYLEEKYGVKYNVKWLSPKYGIFPLFIYYGWLLKEFVRRGVIFNRTKKDYKISMEASWGFEQKTLRNDVLIDNHRFKKEDILILEFCNSSHQQRTRAFKEAKERGYDTASLPKLRININKNIPGILSFYFLVPFRLFFQLFLARQSYLYNYICLFHRRSFPIELLMNLFYIKCNISLKDWGDIAETMTFNKYGTKNVIFHWSDFTFYRAYEKAFITHNIFFAWGDIHYDLHSDTYNVDKKINIGCIYKKAFNDGIANKDDIKLRAGNFKSDRKTVVFFDTSFHNAIEFTERFFLDYLELIKELCRGNRKINVLLKPKTTERYESRLSAANQNRYIELWDVITGCDNFNYLDPSRWGIEEAIAISDICVSMGMTTASTIALICGKEGLYFDTTGNRCHPFARRYSDIIVFNEKGLLFKQIENILNGKFKCRDVISETEIRSYDAFSDDDALERLKDNLYELTL